MFHKTVYFLVTDGSFEKCLLYCNLLGRKSLWEMEREINSRLEPKIVGPCLAESSKIFRSLVVQRNKLFLCEMSIDYWNSICTSCYWFGILSPTIFGQMAATVICLMESCLEVLNFAILHCRKCWFFIWKEDGWIED